MKQLSLTIEQRIVDQLIHLLDPVHGASATDRDRPMAVNGDSRRALGG